MEPIIWNHIIMIMVLALSQPQTNNFGQTRKEAAVNTILESLHYVTAEVQTLETDSWLLAPILCTVSIKRPFCNQTDFEQVSFDTSKTCNKKYCKC